jgi:hypothetical protein
MVSQVLTKREILRKLTTAMALSTHQYASPLTDGKRLEHLNQLRCVSFLELAGLKDGVIPSRFSGGERQWRLMYHPTDDEMAACRRNGAPHRKSRCCGSAEHRPSPSKPASQPYEDFRVANIVAWLVYYEQ